MIIMMIPPIHWKQYQLGEICCASFKFALVPGESPGVKAGLKGVPAGDMAVRGCLVVSTTRGSRAEIGGGSGKLKSIRCLLLNTAAAGKLVVNSCRGSLQLL